MQTAATVLLQQVNEAIESDTWVNLTFQTLVFIVCIFFIYASFTTRTNKRKSVCANSCNKFVS